MTIVIVTITVNGHQYYEYGSGTEPASQTCKLLKTYLKLDVPKVNFIDFNIDLRKFNLKTIFYSWLVLGIHMLDIHHHILDIANILKQHQSIKTN